jgi:hypothetical protein
LVSELSVSETHSKEQKVFNLAMESKPDPRTKLSTLSVTKFSEREISRQLAGVCTLLLRLLARDFDTPHPEAVLIVPTPTSEGVELKILRRD